METLFPYVALVINLVGLSFLKQMHRPCQSVLDRVIVRYYFLGISIKKILFQFKRGSFYFLPGPLQQFR